MRLSIITCTFPPEPFTSARTSHDLAKALSDRGHSVQVICPRNGVEGCSTGAVENGVSFAVVRSWMPRWRRGGKIISRLCDELLFGPWAAAARGFRPDVVYINSWPVLAVPIAVALLRLFGVPYVVSVQDLYPETLVHLGVVRYNSPVWLMVRSMDRWVLRGAVRVVTISEGFRKALVHGRGLLEDQVCVVPNWVDMNRLDFLGDSQVTRRAFGATPAELVVLFLGNLGEAAGANHLAALAEVAAETGAIRFWVGGRGSAVQRLDVALQRRGVANTRLLGFIPESDLAAVHAAADVCLLTITESTGASSLPSKLMTYMAAAKPVFVLGDTNSEVARIVREAEAGFAFGHDDLDEAVAVLKGLAADRTRLRALGVAGRRYAEVAFSKDGNLSSLVRLLEEAGASQGEPAALG